MKGYCGDDPSCQGRNVLVTVTWWTSLAETTGTMSIYGTPMETGGMTLSKTGDSSSVSKSTNSLNSETPTHAGTTLSVQNPTGNGIVSSSRNSQETGMASSVQSSTDPATKSHVGISTATPSSSLGERTLHVELVIMAYPLFVIFGTILVLHL